MLVLAILGGLSFNLCQYVPLDDLRDCMDRNILLKRRKRGETKLDPHRAIVAESKGM